MSGADQTPAALLPWDTEFFGFRIGRVNSARLDAAALRATLEWSAREKVRCLYLSADPGCADTLALAHEGGFRFVDLRVDFQAELAAVEPAAGPGFRAATAQDLPALTELARVAHTDTRFFKDAGFPAARVADLYAEWIQRDFRENQVFAIAGAKGAPAGYVTCAVDAAAHAGRIGLIAVAAGEQGRGLGRILVQGARHWLRERGCREVRVATQASNLAAQRLYQGQGFRTAETRATFHRWF
jgi:dTDP-4-amino-4,6-dideoxy-D-galactose acyltransferase